MGDHSLSSTATNPFVGRRRELETLVAGLSHAASSHAKLFLVSGEPGIGKTRLAERLAAHATADGFLVLWGRSWEGDGAPAYWPWIQILRLCSANLESGSFSPGQRLLSLPASADSSKRSESRSHDREEAQFQLFDSVATVLRSAALARPLLLIIDDLHDADPPSLRMLAFMAHQLDRTCILGTYRDFEVRRSKTLSNLIGALARTAHHIPLSGLDRGETAALLEAIAGSRVGKFAASLLFQATGGNPFFVEGLVRLLRAEGTDLESDDPPLAQLKVPQGVSESIRRRCATLSEGANSLMTVAAIIGNELNYEILERILCLPMANLLDLLDECCGASLLTPIGERRYRFSHALIRSSIYDDLANAERLRMHLLVGQALEQIYAANPEPHLAELAHHFRQAAHSADVAERAISYSVRAGEAAYSVFAYEETRSHWEAALRLMERFGADLERRAQLLERLGGDQIVSNSTDMVSFLQAALTLYQQCERRDRAASLQGWLGYCLAVLPGPQMDVPRGFALLRKAEENVRSQPDTYDKAVIYISLAGAAHQALRTDEGLDASRRAANIGTAINNQTLWSAAVAALGIHSSRLGRLREARALLERARAEVDPSIHAATCAIAAWGGLFCINLWDPCEAQSWYAAELTRPRATQMANWRALLLHQMVEAQITHGDLAEARRLLDQVGHGSRLAALLALYEGEWDQALSVTVKLLHGSRRIGSRFTEMSCHFALARIHTARAEDRQAETALQQALKIASAGPHIPAELEARAGLALFYARAAKTEDAAEHLTRCREIAEVGEEWRGLAGAVARAEGAIAAAVGNFDSGLPKFEQALRIFQHYALVWEEAETCHDLGLALISKGEHRLAIEKFGDAIDLYGKYGAGARWLDRERRIKSSLELHLPGRSQSDSSQAQSAVTSQTDLDDQSIFRHEGDYWTIGFGKDLLRLKDSKGLAYLAHLLARPGVEISARDMASIGGASTTTAHYETRIWDGAAQIAVGLGDAGATIDRHAIAQYKRRLADLDELTAEAERNNDTGHCERLRWERELLANELSAAVGVGGRVRRAASHSERARWLVTKGIKGAIRKIAQTNPDLANHLRLSVRTGAFCVYLPARPVTWRF
jgi:tetratricopeptide (TPR) repeat protein